MLPQSLTAASYEMEDPILRPSRVVAERCPGMMRSARWRGHNADESPKAITTEHEKNLATLLCWRAITGFMTLRGADAYPFRNYPPE